MLRYATALLVLLALLLVPTTAYADEHYWEADPPKGLDPGSLRCTTVSTYMGNTVTQVNYAPADADNPWNHRAWADRYLKQDNVNVHEHLYKNPGADPSIVKMTCTLVGG